MKTLAAALIVSGLFATAANAGDVKLQYDNVRVEGKAPNVDRFRIQLSDNLYGPLNYEVELASSQAQTGGGMNDVLRGAVGTNLNVGPFVVQPSVEVGTVRAPGGRTTFWGVEGKASSPTPVKNLIATVGYRYRDSMDGSDFSSTRYEATGEYIVNSKYSVGVSYYKNYGSVSNDTVGGFVRVRF